MEDIDTDYDLLPSHLINYYVDILSPERYIQLSNEADGMGSENILQIEEGKELFLFTNIYHDYDHKLSSNVFPAICNSAL